MVFPVAGLYNVIYLLNFINYSGEPSGYEARLVGGADNTTTLTDTANAFVDEGRGPENHVSFSSEITLQFETNEVLELQVYQNNEPTMLIDAALQFELLEATE